MNLRIQNQYLKNIYKEINQNKGNQIRARTRLKVIIHHSNNFKVKPYRNNDLLSHKIDTNKILI